MTVYNQYTYTSVFVGQTGHAHVKAEGAEARAPMAITCSACEPILVREGWVHAAELVPLTDVQEREKERAEREGNLAVRQAAEALSTSLSSQLAGGMAPKRRPGRPKARPE